MRGRLQARSGGGGVDAEEGWGGRIGVPGRRDGNGKPGGREGHKGGGMGKVEAGKRVVERDPGREMGVGGRRDGEPGRRGVPGIREERRKAPEPRHRRGASPGRSRPKSLRASRRGAKLRSGGAWGGVGTSRGGYMAWDLVLGISIFCLHFCFLMETGDGSPWEVIPPAVGWAGRPPIPQIL